MTVVSHVSPATDALVVVLNEWAVSDAEYSLHFCSSGTDIMTAWIQSVYHRPCDLASLFLVCQHVAHSACRWQEPLVISIEETETETQFLQRVHLGRGVFAYSQHRPHLTLRVTHPHQLEWISQLPQHSVLSHFMNIHITCPVRSFDAFKTVFPHLRRLNMSFQSHLPSLVPLSQLDHLDTLVLRGCTTLTNHMLTVPHFHRLAYLVVDQCDALGSCEFLKTMPQLIWLSIRECHLLYDMSPLSHVTQLRYLDTSGCSKIKDVSALSHVKTLTWLIMQGLHIDPLDQAGQATLQALSQLRHLVSLDLSECLYIRSQHMTECIQQGLHSLKYMWLAGCTDLDTMSFCIHLPQLEYVNVRSCLYITKLYLPIQSNHVTHICLKGCEQLEDISHIRFCRKLQELDLEGCKKVADFQVLKECRQLKRLNLSGSKRVSHLSFLYGAQPTPIAVQKTRKQLRKLRKKSSKQDMDTLDTEEPEVPIVQVETEEPQGQSILTVLIINECSSIFSLDPLSSLTQLRCLSLEKTNIHSLSCLSALNALQVINVQYCAKIKDLSPLCHLNSLEHVFLYGAACVKQCVLLAQVQVHHRRYFETSDVLAVLDKSKKLKDEPMDIVR